MSISLGAGLPASGEMDINQLLENLDPDSDLDVNLDVNLDLY
jgi:hypothetical protein